MYGIRMIPSRVLQGDADNTQHQQRHTDYDRRSPSPLFHGNSTTLLSEIEQHARASQIRSKTGPRTMLFVYVRSDTMLTATAPAGWWARACKSRFLLSPSAGNQFRRNTPSACRQADTACRQGERRWHWSQTVRDRSSRRAASAQTGTPLALDFVSARVRANTAPVALAGAPRVRHTGSGVGAQLRTQQEALRGPCEVPASFSRLALAPRPARKTNLKGPGPCVFD